MAAELYVMVAPQGFEPRYAAPEAAVLPLNEGATSSNWLVLKPGLTLAAAGAGPRKANLFIIRGFHLTVKLTHGPISRCELRSCAVRDPASQAVFGQRFIKDLGILHPMSTGSPP
jgi:hypothetical protein